MVDFTSLFCDFFCFISKSWCNSRRICITMNKFTSYCYLLVGEKFFHFKCYVRAAKPIPAVCQRHAFFTATVWPVTECELSRPLRALVETTTMRHRSICRGVVLHPFDQWLAVRVRCMEHHPVEPEPAQGNASSHIRARGHVVERDVSNVAEIRGALRIERVEIAPHVRFFSERAK